MTHPAKLLLLIILLGASNSAAAQVLNLLKNPNADSGTEHWRAFGNVVVESCNNGSSCFVLREGGYFVQDVTLPEDAPGQYAVLLGKGSSDGEARSRLYGYMMNAGDFSGGRIYAYLGGQQMTSKIGSYGKWETLWGVFKIQPGTVRIRFFLQQAVRGQQDGASVSRFDELALYVFRDEVAARSFTGPSGAVFPRQSQTAPRCTTLREEIPPLFGLRIGMTIDQVLALYPGNENDPTVMRALNLIQNKRAQGRVSMFLNPHASGPNAELQDFQNFFLMFWEGRLFRIDAQFRNPGAKTIDEFVEKHRHHLNMPEPGLWDEVSGNPASFGKYRICDGIEIRYFLARTTAAKPSKIAVFDTTIEGRSVEAPALQQKAEKH